MIVGMDFGTTNSGMSVFDGENLRLIPLDPANQNPHVARSAMYIANDRAIHIGRAATDVYYEQNLNRPSKIEMVRVGEIEMTFAEIGTFIRDVYIEKDIFSPGRLFLSFKMGLSSPKYLGTTVGTEFYYLEDIIATYLYITRKRAQQYLDHELDTIVLGRPVRFSDDEQHNALAQERLLQAAFRAGYKTIYLQYEPIAAAHHYEMSLDKEENVLVFDFGGGTLDISVMRLGNPKTRAVLATGGIPIAGDVFDRKLVRGKLPQHFGEGATYRHNNQELPVPSAFFNAFSDWQELLALQLPERLDALKRMKSLSNQPVKLDALINLITSSYALKMYDVMERAKRNLSDERRTTIRFEGTGFKVLDWATRSEFERIIRTDIRSITERLDQVVTEAGLKSEQIDAVIRTGGSSQIPAFVDMLSERFPNSRVMEIDAFSSVTSGLGVIAHQIETGEVSIESHHVEDYPPGDYLAATDQGGIPVVDIDRMKQFIDLREDQTDHADDRLLLLGHNKDDSFAGTSLSHEDADNGYKLKGLSEPADLLRPQDRVVLLTTDYRCIHKSAQQIADLKTIDATLEETEQFYEDDFGREMVNAIVRWQSLEDANRIALITSRGYVRLFIGETFTRKLAQPMPLNLEKATGYPTGMVNISDGGDLIVLAKTGRAARLPVAMLETHENRVITNPPNSDIAGAVHVNYDTELIVATASGYAKRIASDCIPYIKAFNTTASKVATRTNPVSLITYQPSTTLYAITTRRIMPIDPTTIPLCNTERTDYKLTNLRKGERLLAIKYLNTH